MRCSILLISLFARCLGAEQNNVVSPAVPNKDLQPLIRRALEFVPQLRREEVVVLAEVRSLFKHLLEWGYDSETANKTIQEVKELAEFTVDHHFPVFVNAGSRHIQRILLSWNAGRSPDQAARVMASDLYHEYLHAARRANECEALTGHLALLKQWRAAGILTIADLYISLKESELRSLKEGPQQCGGEGANR